MTAVPKSPAPASAESTSRRWYWPLHGATCAAILSTAAVLFLANVPGQEVLRPDIHDNGKYGPHWESCNSYYEHGWPTTYLRRERYSPQFAGPGWRITDRSPWDFTTSGERVIGTSLFVNGLSGVALLGTVGLAMQLWFGWRRSIWQFCLIDAFAVVTFVSLALAWYVWNRQEHHREIELVKSLKRNAESAQNMLTSEEGLPSWSYELQPGGPTFLRRLLGDRLFQPFDRVIQCEYLGNAPQYAGNFPHLRVFSVHEVTPDFPKYLRIMKNVEALDFTFTGADSWREFPAMPRLRCINLHYAGSDASTAWLARCPNLEMIMLTDCDVSDVGARNLAGLKRLKILYVSGMDFTAEGFRLLSTLPELEELWVESRDAGDEAMPYLSQMHSLRKLTLCDMPVSDEGLLQLASLHSLEELAVEDTEVTGDGVKQLQALLPSCTVYHHP